MFDLFLFPLHLSAGQEQAHLPGLLAASPPRRADRNRASEVLLVLATLSPDTLTPEAWQKLLQQVTDKYYRTRGSAITALRATIEQFNEQLLNHNLRTAAEGGQMSAALSLAVLRHDRLFLAQAGNSHALVLGAAEVQHFYDAETAGRSLGVSRNPNIRFFQAQIQAGDLLLFSPNPTENWNETALAGSPQLTLNQLRRRLLNQAGSELQAAVTQFQTGPGQIHLLKPKALPETPAAVEPGAPVAEADSALPPTPTPEETEETEAPIAAPPEWTLGAGFTPPEPGETRPADEPEESQPGEVPPLLPEQLATGGIYLTGERYEPEAQPSPPPLTAAPEPQPVKAVRPAAVTLPQPPAQWRRRLAELWLGGRATSQRAGESSKTFLTHLLPGDSDNPPAFTSLTMLLIALAVPILVVVIAITVYFNTGRSAQHQVYLEQAKLYVAQAIQQSDPDLQRNAWSQALYWLDKAESYGQSEESNALRGQVQEVLDSMDGIVRLDFQPTLPSGLGGSIEISQIAANATEAYLLDKTKGRVLRIFLTGQGYQLDTDFQCEPGPLGGLYISPLVDLVTLPPNNDFKATIAALDNAGNLLYCAPGLTPTATTLTAPDNGWGQITRFTIDQGILYVLDAGNNAVWLYPGVNYRFSEAPRLFFDNEVPLLTDIADLAINGEDLYLLHQDGKMTMCVFRAFSLGQTKCTDPAPYGDARAGRESEPITFSDAQFAQLVTTQPPDPSLFILDTASTAIYHFSLRLNLQRVLRPQTIGEYELPTQPPTAFTITSGHVVLVAFGDKIYYAPMP